MTWSEDKKEITALDLTKLKSLKITDQLVQLRIELKLPQEKVTKALDLKLFFGERG